LVQARRRIYAALRLVAEWEAHGSSVQNPMSVLLGAIVLYLVDRSEVEQAVQLYALALCDPFVANSQWYEDVAGKPIAAAAATLPPEVVAAAQERGRARDLEATAKELLEEFEAEMQDEIGALPKADPEEQDDLIAE
jgi:hypothetical protein